MASVAPGFFARLDAGSRYYELRDAQPAMAKPPHDYVRARSAFAPNLLGVGTVIGLGSGDGRDLRPFQASGRNVLGIEPCASRRRRAVEAGVPSIDGAFENFTSKQLPAIAGIWCGAALRHVPSDCLVRAFRNIAAALPTGGPVFFLVELGAGSEWLRIDEREPEAEAFIQRFSSATVAAALLSSGLAVVDQWTSGDLQDRPGCWLSTIAIKA
jgi:hypothetical protein